MAAVAPPADQAADMLQKLSLDSKANAIEVPDSTKKVQRSVGSNNMVNGIQSDRSITPLLPDAMDPAVWYTPSGYLSTACYYGGSDAGNWEEYSRFTNQEGVDVTTGAYGDASLMYQHGYGYNLYAPYSPAASPVPTLAHDGQLYGAQQYQYPSPYFQSMTPTNSPYPNPANQVKGEMTTCAATEQAPLPVDSTNSKSNGNANNGGVKTNNGALLARPTYLNSSYNLNGAYGRGSLPGGIPASTYQDPRFAFDGLHSPIPWLESTYYPDGQPRPITSSSMASSIANVNSLPPYRHQNFRPHLMGFNHPRPLSGLNSASGYINRMYPNTNKLYGQYGNAFRSGLGYGSNDYASRTSGRGWMAVDSKYKPRGRGNGFYCYGNESMDGLNELNRGPRTKSTTNSKGFTPVTLAVKGQSIPLSGTAESEKSTATPGREQYNRLDFPVSYTDAKFFIIKSYSEDDVHKSIKYSIWASTENGNKKLDAAFKEAEQKTGECPVFLFFSVNTSGQFVGVAEMVGPVDFNKNVEYWQQDKWIGCFPVKWHIVKDVPNSLLKHITLENNENKPVTNSRDTQEVKLEDGLKVLKIFKDHQCKQCVLDDFDFYEDRQKKIQERKGKLRQLQKQTQIWEGKPTEANVQESINGDQKPHKAPEVVSDTIQVAATTTLLSNADIKTAESSPVPNSGDVVKTAKAASVVPEKNHLANGVVANGC